MANTAVCSTVNDLMINVRCSLLQYAAEAWPWASEEDESLQALLLALAEKERHCVEAMVDFLKSRKAVIDFGVYPQEYTSLHFVALGYFVDRLRTSQKAIIGELESSESDLAGDMEAVNLIESILDTERDIVKQLEELKVSAA